jgi:hypothetical protein
MPKVVDMQEYQRRKRSMQHKITLPKSIKVVYKMAISPYRFGAVLMLTNKGAYEWDIMNETLEKCIEYKEGDI